MTPATGSLMPEGLEPIMTRQELRDLLEFLTLAHEHQSSFSAHVSAT